MNLIGRFQFPGLVPACLAQAGRSMQQDSIFKIPSMRSASEIW